MAQRRKKKFHQGFRKPNAENQQAANGEGTGDDTLIDVLEVKEQAQDFFERNQKSILAGLAGILLLVGGYLGYKYAIQIPNNKAAMESIHRAEYQFKRDSFSLALTNPGDGYDGFLDIIDKYGSTKVGNLAKYYAGVSYLNLGDFEKAVEYLNKFSPADDVTPSMKHGAMGDAYGELGEMDKAASSYKKAVSDGNQLTAPYYLYKLGLLQYKQGDKSSALASFEKIKKDYPTSSFASDIEKYIKLASS